MNLSDPVFLLFIGLVAVGLGAHALLRRINPDHRNMRKRRKNYGKVINKAKRPMVMLNVRTDKK